MLADGFGMHVSTRLFALVHTPRGSRAAQNGGVNRARGVLPCSVRRARQHGALPAATLRRPLPAAGTVSAASRFPAAVQRGFRS